MKCDIIIPVWNQLEHTRSCIENIVKNTSYPYRLILVDNASGPDTKRYLEEVRDKKSSDVALIRNEENLGFIKAVNQGLRVSDAPYVCIMNNDTLPAPGWLDRMVGFAERHMDVGLVNPQCGGHGDMPIDFYAERLKQYKDKFMEMNQCQGFCMLVKREVIDKIGYLDEAFGIGGYDDTDYSMRAHRAGFKCVAARDAYVYHRLHGSFDASGDRENWVGRNRKIFFEKWGKAPLRIGIAISMKRMDDETVMRVMALAYGLAREWSWVHIWIRGAFDKGLLKKRIYETLDKRGFPPHQNIRIDAFGIPGFLFGLTIAGKLVERSRKRMRDKRFDALIAFDDNLLRIVRPFARMMSVGTFSLSIDEPLSRLEAKGKDIALSIKKEKKDNG